MNDETTNPTPQADPVTPQNESDRQPGIADENDNSQTDTVGIADDLPANGGAQGTEASDPPKPPAAPEPYELTAPEDFPIPEDNLKSFTAKANELGLTKAQAEGMLNWHKSFHSDVQKFMRENEEAMLKSWGAELAKDSEFGGANYRATLADARKAFDAFDADGALRAMLRETKAQYHPAVIRVVARVGRALGEDKFITGNREGGRSAIPLEERMWPNFKI